MLKQPTQQDIRRLLGAPADPTTRGPEQIRECTFHLPADITKPQFLDAMSQIVPAFIDMMREQEWEISLPYRVKVEGPFMALDDAAQPREGYKMFRLLAVCRPKNAGRIRLLTPDTHLEIKDAMRRMSPN